MQKNKKITNIFIIVGVVIVLGALFIIPRLTSPERGIVKNWKEADIRCVAEETKLLQHIHPHLSIIIDSEEEAVPKNIGITPSCTGELHTHNETGEIHVESARADKEFAIGQFFAVWGKSIDREGYTVKIIIDGKEMKDEG